MPVPRFRQLAHAGDSELTGLLRDIATSHGHRGVFNPSIARVEGATVLAYRGIREGEKTIRAFLAVCPNDSAVAVPVDLTEIGAQIGVDRVSDPKIVRLGARLFVTFNTGFSASGFNEIYLVPVFPSIGEPQRIVMDFERQQVEKNWAFAQNQQDALLAVYQLHPYSEVFLTRGEPGDGGDLVFAKRTPRRVESAAAGLSIGTQLLSVSESDGASLLIGHEKWNLPRRSKRMYFGRAVSITGLGGQEVEVKVRPERLIHHWKDSLPRMRGVHNYNLMAATYFSGLDRSGDDLLLGYGINDTRFGIARVKRADVWA